MPVAESFLQVRFWAPLTDAILKKKRCSQMSPAFAFVFRVPTWDLVFIYIYNDCSHVMSCESCGACGIGHARFSASAPSFFCDWIGWVWLILVLVSQTHGFEVRGSAWVVWKACASFSREWGWKLGLWSWIDDDDFGYAHRSSIRGGGWPSALSGEVEHYRTHFQGLMCHCQTVNSQWSLTCFPKSCD